MRSTYFWVLEETVLLGYPLSDVFLFLSILNIPYNYFAFHLAIMSERLMLSVSVCVLVMYAKPSVQYPFGDSINDAVREVGDIMTIHLNVGLVSTYIVSSTTHTIWWPKLG